MTLADQIRSGQAQNGALEFHPSLPHCRQHYRVDLRDPASHLLDVELRIEEVNRTLPLQVKMPVWTPGSYLVREYARHLQDLQVRDQEGSALRWRKVNKNTWEVQVDPTAVDPATVILRYRLYAYDLTVRTNHMDLSHAYFNGAATFLYVVGRVHEPLSLTLVLPDPSWQIATSLPHIKTQGDRQEVTFTAATYDELVDSPVEAGLQQTVHFQVLNKPHQWTVWGEGNLNLEQTVQDTRRIIEATAHLFGGDLPYPRYLFLLHLSAGGFGGLEHRCSTTLNFSRFEFHHPEGYQRFLALVAHEFFHTWNVKRLYPRDLEAPSYDQETYLSCLWFVEGATSYYENLMLLRAGLIPASRFLQVIGEKLTSLAMIPGREVQSLSEASFDTWIKLYRPHENSHNSQVSYYLKGALVCLILDLHIRACTAGVNSLDSVIQDLWQQFGQQEQGYTDAELRQAFSRAAGQDLSDLFARFVDGTEDLDLNPFLQPFGLQVTSAFTQLPPSPYLGLNFKSDSSVITSVDQGSPAQRAGLWAGDELLALNHFKITPAQLPDRLQGVDPTLPLTVTVFQQEQLKSVVVTPEPARPDLMRVERLPNPTASQDSLLRGWLGVPADDASALFP